MFERNAEVHIATKEPLKVNSVDRHNTDINIFPASNYEKFTGQNL
jgi:hypothetical protein